MNRHFQKNIVFNNYFKMGKGSRLKVFKKLQKIGHVDPFHKKLLCDMKQKIIDTYISEDETTKMVEAIEKCAIESNEYYLETDTYITLILFDKDTFDLYLCFDDKPDQIRSPKFWSDLFVSTDDDTKEPLFDVVIEKIIKKFKVCHPKWAVYTNKGDSFLSQQQKPFLEIEDGKTQIWQFHFF